MTPRRGKVRDVCLTSVIALLLMVSCMGDRCACPDSEKLSRETADGLVQVFAQSLEDGSIQTYSECLSQTYKFFFMESDWEDAGVTPAEPYWDKARDAAATANLFGSEYVSEVICDFEVVHRETSASHISLRAEPDLRVTVEGPGQEPITYWANRTLLNLIVVADPGNPDLWSIQEIHEIGLDVDVHAAGHPLKGGGEYSTVGKIKAMFK